MDIKFWIDKWEKNSLGFHQTETEPLMIKYFTEIRPGVVFVPLCGKSLDMIWFVEKGWKVIGVEASPIACRSFFEENKIRFEEIKKPDFTLFESKKINILCGDIFSLPAFEVKEVTAVYDRGALIALPPDKRKKYAEHMIRLLDASTCDQMRLLLLCLEYPKDAAAGPPFSVMATEINELYGNRFNIRELERHEEASLSEENPKFKDHKVFEVVYWITSKK